MANSHPQQQKPLKLVSECYVKPIYGIEAAKQSYHLGPTDLVMLTADPMQKGLLYTLNTTTTTSSSDDIHVIEPSTRTKLVSHLLDKLKHSLSIALVHFYPLAGRLTTQTYTDENACSIFVDCNKGPGARFIHASALDLTVSDVASPIDVTIMHPFFDLGEKYVNYDGHTRALLSIQVTELLDGVFIGFSMSHSVADGTSFTYFINMLSDIFKADDYTNEITLPILNYKPWLSNDNEGIPILKLPFVEVEKFINRGYDPGLLRERIFHFSHISMTNLKARANQESDETRNNISSFQALIALVWRSITRARGLPLDQQTTCSLVIGARSRLDPPISDDYFGNFISRTQWACTVEELLGNRLGWAALNLKKAIVARDGKAIVDLYKKVADSPTLFPRRVEPDDHGTNSVVTGGSARYNMYRPEFGLGRALAVRMGYGHKVDGKVTANPAFEGQGSVDVEICLRQHFMAALEIDEEFMSFVSLEYNCGSKTG